MDKKSLEKILEKFAGLPEERSTWGKGYLENYLKEREHLIIQCSHAIRDYYLEKLPKENQLENIIINYCSKRGFDEYTNCAKFIYAEMRKAIEGV